MAVKKLIEVALPLDAINAASIREKSIRHGHPATLHLWWARRPLATARAVIWASLVDDPSSHPNLFPTEEDQRAERERLFEILEKLVIWENSNDKTVLEAAKAEIQKSIGNAEISLLDPFSGGGAIPLEAQRLGLKAYAHDLNPVAVTINKAMIEIPSRFSGLPAINPDAQRRRHINTWERSSGLAADVEYYGNWLKEEAFSRIGHLYPEVRVPSDQGGGYATVIAWIWARTVTCPNPACGCQMPLVNSFELSKKRGKRAWAIPNVDANTKRITFTIGTGDGNVPASSKVAKGQFRCIACGSLAPKNYIHEQFQLHKDAAQLMAVIAEGKNGRLFIAPDAEQIAAATVDRPDDYPTQAMNTSCTDLVSGRGYGFTEWHELFTNRQLVALTTFTDLLGELQEKIEHDGTGLLKDDDRSLAADGAGAKAYGQAISVYLAFLIDQVANHSSVACSWNAPNTQMRNTFGRQAIPMVWDYAECNIFSNSTGSFKNLFTRMLKAFDALPSSIEGEADQFDAQSDTGLRDIVISTDPPYYDNISYADLSDFFYIWLRRSMRSIYPQLYSTLLVPKAEELVATPYRFNSDIEARNFFEEGMYEAVSQMYLTARDDIPVTIYYAFKQGETTTVNEVEATASTGWETMLAAIIHAGFSITGTWPVRTEKQGRIIGNGTNALASSIVLVCRKRSKDAIAATRREFVNALKRELKPALDKLQTSNIAPVDLAQSAIGPGIGVYSRFSKVLEADGNEMTVRSALQIINQELDLYFTDQDSDLDRESRFCVDLYTQTAFNEIRFGEADVLARAKNTSIEGIAAKGAISSAKGFVRLLGRDEIRDMPAPDFCWLFTQQLTHAMETGGIEACAKMLKDIYDGRADNARALAYRLFTIADKKSWNQEAFAYNSLVVAWRDIESRAAQLKQETPVQTALDI